MSATFSQYFFPFDHPHTLFAFRTRKCGSMRSTLWTDPNVLCTKDRPNRIESQDSRSIRCCANGCTLASSSLSLPNAHIRDCSYGEHRMHACMPVCASECAVLCCAYAFIPYNTFNTTLGHWNPSKSSRRTFRIVSLTSIRTYYFMYIYKTAAATAKSQVADSCGKYTRQ